jgi:hypothetical protein
MKITLIIIGSILGIVLIILIGQFIRTSWGIQIDPKSKNYYRNRKGIYYSPLNNWLEVQQTYLHDVDAETFVVLADHFAKDKYKAYFEGSEIKDVDVASFYVDPSGLPKDKYHVYIYDDKISNCRPAKCDIDLVTAEHPPFLNRFMWLRDKDHYYLDEQRLDIDRNNFHEFGRGWYVDEYQIYDMRWDSQKKNYVLNVVDTIQTPLEIIQDTYYLRNGRNIICVGKVVVRNLDIHTIKQISDLTCAVNDMIIYQGKIRLKDTVDVSTLQEVNMFLKDKNHVYYRFEILDQLDAPTFKHVKKDIYEDKNGRYKYSYRFHDPNKGFSLKRIN